MIRARSGQTNFIKILFSMLELNLAKANYSFEASPSRVSFFFPGLCLLLTAECHLGHFWQTIRQPS